VDFFLLNTPAMNLCIDQGNSRTKLAIFADDGKMVNNFIYKRFDASEIEKICSLYPVTNSIISSVINIDPAVVNTLNRLSRRFILFDHNTPVPLENKYETPQTLGQDRLAAAVGANALSPNKNLLIIDAGSAITYDFVNADNQYLGGNIAPGIKMRFTALKNQTKKLPLVEIGEKQIIPLFGANTNDAILSGVVRGIRYEIEGYVRTLQKRVGQFDTYMTGGGSTYLQTVVRCHTILEKHLVLIGLNRILTHNLA